MRRPRVRQGVLMISGWASSALSSPRWPGWCSARSRATVRFPRLSAGAGCSARPWQLRAGVRRQCFPRYVINSTMVAVGATLMGCCSAFPPPMRWRATAAPAVGVVLLAARMAPGIAFLIPLFVMFLSLHLVGGYVSLIASHLIFTLPLTVWMMVGFIEAFPRRSSRRR